MRPCCKETYKKTLEEVILLIENMRGKSISCLYGTLKHAVNMLEKEEKPVNIYFNEWKNHE